MTEFDQLAIHYDETRGGEARGEEYAADIDAHLPPGAGPVLEIGVGTGVVALGLARRGRRVIGLDVSAPMLARAASRLGPVLVQADALAMPTASWLGSPSHELATIERRAWPALRALDAAAVEEVTRPAVEALLALPPSECVRRATADMVVLRRAP